VISESRIGSPIINSPQAVCVFNRPSFDKFSPRVKPGGLLLVNSSLINVTTDRTDVTEILVPANQMAIDAGSVKVANLAMLGAFVAATNVVQHENLLKVLKEKLGYKKELLDLNLKVVEQGRQLALARLERVRKA